jgi:hypothetical protein
VGVRLNDILCGYKYYFIRFDVALEIRDQKQLHVMVFNDIAACGRCIEVEEGVMLLDLVGLDSSELGRHRACAGKGEIVVSLGVAP